MIKAVSHALSKKANGEKGFTLIELLVVVIIIGILAAVAIPVFLNMREGAWKASVESDVANAVLVVEQATTANNGSIGTMLDTNVSNTSGSQSYELNGIKGSVSEGNTITIKKGATTNTYTIEGTNTDVGTSKIYKYDSATGTSAWN